MCKWRLLHLSTIPTSCSAVRPGGFTRRGGEANLGGIWTNFVLVWCRACATSWEHSTHLAADIPAGFWGGPAAAGFFWGDTPAAVFFGVTLLLVFFGVALLLVQRRGAPRSLCWDLAVHSGSFLCLGSSEGCLAPSPTLVTSPGVLGELSSEEPSAAMQIEN